VDLRDPLARRWLSACLWPRDAERAERLRRAMALAEAHAPTVRAHTDGLSLLADWLDQLPPDVTPVLWHSWVLAYFSPGPLADFRRRAEALVRERGLWWLSAEDGPRTQALSGLTPPADPVPGEERADPAQHTFWVLSGPDARSADGIGRRLLARSTRTGAGWPGRAERDGRLRAGDKGTGGSGPRHWALAAQGRQVTRGAGSGAGAACCTKATSASASLGPVWRSRPWRSRVKPSPPSARKLLTATR
jgi:hypothetical protein